MSFRNDPKALAGLRIIEIGFQVAGPYASKLLASCGAEVIKIESRKRLDIVRRTGRLHQYSSLLPGELPPPDLPTDTVFSNNINLGKMSVSLDLKKPEAVAIAKRLVSFSDVFLENFKGGAINRLGLGYPDLKQVKPDIIMLSTSNAGIVGPEAGYLGYAALFAALGGLGHLTGYGDGPPTEVRMPMDVFNAVFAAVAVMAAVVHRQETGEGQYVDYSSREGSSFLISDSLMDYFMNNTIQCRDGNRDETKAPHNCYRCRGEDKWISIAVGNDREWVKLCHAMADPDWTREKRFATCFDRWKNQEEMDQLLEAWTINYTHYEVFGKLQEAGVAAAPSFSSDELWGDPHLEARKCFAVVDHPVLGAQPTFVPPWKFSKTPATVTDPGPTLGQHDEYVYGDLLGLSRSEVEDLVFREVIC